LTEKTEPEVWKPRPVRQRLRMVLIPCGDCGGRHASWWNKTTRAPSCAPA
jgi:hypothetical protein